MSLERRAFTSIRDTPGLPRVLLIGDSISVGYTLGVRAKLMGRANVHRPPENCRDTGWGLLRLEAWLADGRWSIIHFNFGLHDLKYLDEGGHYVSPGRGRQVTTVEQYEKNLRALVVRMRQTGAHLIFATTTPVPGSSPGRVEGDERRYNDVAIHVMMDNGVAIDDLRAVVAPHRGQLQLPKDVHFNAEGYARLADAVVASVGALLTPPEQ